jgi:TetR/AcrR family transcriptional repressor of nem operon
VLVAGRPREFETEEILDRAMLVFWERGYDATSMSDLTEALGLGRQSLYGAFGDKRELFLKCLERYMEQVLQKGIIDVLDAPGSPLGNVRRVLDTWEAYAKGADFRGCLLGHSLTELGMRDPKIDEIMVKKLDRLTSAFARTLERAQNERELRKSADPKSMARSLVAFAQGAAVVCKVWRDPDTVHDTMIGAFAILEAHAKEPRR